MQKQSSLGIAVYRCRECHHVFNQPPGPVGWKDGACPKCKCWFVDWINFESWQEEYEKVKMKVFTGVFDEPKELNPS